MKERRGGGLGKATFPGWVVLSLPGLPAPARPAHDDPPVERTQKNIRVLHGLPTSQLIPVMAVMANPLGVTCAHCHTSERESDDKPPKEAARRMIRMTLDANRVFYEAKTVITCNTCHRGAIEPVGIPRIADAGWNRSRPAAPEPNGLPTVGDVLDRYVLYLGGWERIRRIGARRLTGVVSRDSGRASAAGDFLIDQRSRTTCR
ncbi:MAG TPA: photosynthetic reaction center cytochrome c subunit family protein [Thermoanaerobaculia bacterium]